MIRSVRGLPILRSRGFATMYPDWRASVADTLRAGPWCWPPNEDDEAYARALSLVPSGPSLQPGTVPIVVVEHERGYLLAARLADAASLDGNFISSTRDATASLARATDLVPHVIPFLWKRVDRAAVLECSQLRDSSDLVLSAIQGKSCGLSFLLAHASRLLGVAVDPNTIASVALIDETSGPDRPDGGGVGCVSGLTAKLRTIWERAPRITRVLIHHEQVDDARAICTSLGATIEIVPVASAFDVVKEHFERRVRELLTTNGGRPDFRQDLLDDLNAGVLGLGMTKNWAPVARTIAVALRRWSAPDVSSDDRTALRVLWSFARRHQTNTGFLAALDESWLRRQREDRRVRLVANLVQHAHDTGTPPHEQARRLGEACLRDSQGRHHEVHTRLLGALARLQRLQGDHEGAFARQLEIVEMLFATDARQNATFQLSEMYLLAAIRRCADWFAETDRFRQRLHAAGLVGSWSFVDLPRARAMLAEAGGTPEEAATVLQRLWERAEVPHLRWSAGRWLLAARRAEGADAAALTRIENGITGGTRTAVRRDRRVANAFSVLAQMDAALAANRPDDADRLLPQLIRHQPGVVKPLVERAPADRRGAFVAHEFPY